MKKKDIKNKRGQGIIELIVSIVIIFVFVIITVMGGKVLGDINTDMQADPTIQNVSKDTMSNLNDRYSTTFDALVPFIYLVMLLVVVAAGWLSNSHPFIMIFLLLVVIFLMIIGGILSNTWEDFKVEPDLTATITDYPMTDYILSHYMIFTGIIGFALLLSIVIKKRIGD